VALNRNSRVYLLPLLAAIALMVLLGSKASVSATECPEADEVALQWLDKMSRSLRQVSYHGVVTLQRDEDMQVMQVSHAVDDGSSSERLIELTGQGAQVERISHPLDCVHPGDRMLRMETLTEVDPCGIAQQYRFTVIDHERVAGRDAVRMKIEPRDMYRFGYMLSLDEETGLLLKSQTISHGHKTLETMQFAHLSFSDVIPATGNVEVVHEAQHPKSDDANVDTPESRAWTVGWLPRGFAATDPALGNSGRRTYTDGLAVFSVFLEDLNVEMRSGEGLILQGGTMTYTRGMDLTGQSVLVTVIGEVPVNTARMVADSVRWVQ
jgi:sigma-E factor negative regulatory protein RseB